MVSLLTQAGAVDVAISALTAYQMIGDPDAVSVAATGWGALFTLDIMLGSHTCRQPVVEKLRSAGVDSFRFLLDHPLVHWVCFGIETGVTATRVAAQVRCIL